jgi:hypothetical protein
MHHSITMNRLAACAAIGFAACWVPAAYADTVLETSIEHRLQLDFHVSDTALKALLPAGWEPNVATAGPAKDANIRMIFVDQVNITGPDGKPLGAGSNQFVYLAAPVKQTGTSNVAQMVIGGLSADPSAEPGSFPGMLPANNVSMRYFLTGRNVPLAMPSAQDVPVNTQEDWSFSAATGEHMQIHAVYQRAPTARAVTTTNVYSHTDPANYTTWKVDAGVDITRNATVNVGTRLTQFSYKAGGGSIATLFDGTEKVLSVDSQPSYTRVVSKP